MLNDIVLGIHLPRCGHVSTLTDSIRARVSGQRWAGLWRHRGSCLFHKEAAAGETGCFWFPSINTKRSRSEEKTAQREARIESWRPGESGKPAEGQKHISHSCPQTFVFSLVLHLFTDDGLRRLRFFPFFFPPFPPLFLRQRNYTSLFSSWCCTNCKWWWGINYVTGCLRTLNGQKQNVCTHSHSRALD